MRAALAGLVILFAATGCGEEPPSLEALTQAVVDGGAPGALVLVREDAETRTAAAGRRRLDPPRALAAGDRFRVASLTKVFTAVIALQLIQEGRLRLETTVEQLLPGLLDDGEQVTVEDLLSHRSGLYDHTDLPEVYNVDRAWRPEQLVALSARRPRADGFAYSSTNYVILGLMIETTTGGDYADALRARITEPLGLEHTSYEPGGQPSGGAHGHVPTVHDGFVRPATPAADVSAASATWGGTAGAVVSTAGDLATFLEALLQGHLLPRRLLIRMLPAERPGERSYGLGLVAHPLGCGHGIGHTGNLLGTVSVAYRINGRTIVAMTNQHPLTGDSDAAFQRLVRRAACQ